MKTFELNFSFKGAREYIHGTDILEKCGKLLSEQVGGDLEDVDFIIHRMSKRNLSIALYSAAQAPERKAQGVAELTFSMAGQRWKSLLIETEVAPASCYPYDENAIVAVCQFDEANRKVVLQHDTPYTAIETLVAMTKALHLRLFPEMTGSWLFCRWASPKWPLRDGLSGVSVHLTQALGMRFTRSEVCLHDKVLGQIYFSARNRK